MCVKRELLSETCKVFLFGLILSQQFIPNNSSHSVPRCIDLLYIYLKRIAFARIFYEFTYLSHIGGLHAEGGSRGNKEGENSELHGDVFDVIDKIMMMSFGCEMLDA